MLVKNIETGGIIAYTLLEKLGDALYTGQVAVTKEFQNGFGIGSSMYGYVERHAKGFDYLSAHAHVTNNGSRMFHLKNGYTETPARDPEPEPEFLYFMKPTNLEKAQKTLEQAVKERAVLQKKVRKQAAKFSIDTTIERI